MTDSHCTLGFVREKIQTVRRENSSWPFKLIGAKTAYLLGPSTTSVPRGLGLSTSVGKKNEKTVN